MWQGDAIGNAAEMRGARHESATRANKMRNGLPHFLSPRADDPTRHQRPENAKQKSIDMLVRNRSDDGPSGCAPKFQMRLDFRKKLLHGLHARFRFAGDRKSTRLNSSH